MATIQLLIILAISGGLNFDSVVNAKDNFNRRSIFQRQPPTECNVKAYLADPDPSGTNIRRAPNKDAAILRRVTEDNVIVSIIGFSDGWFEISAAENIDDKSIFQGRGWIHSSLLGMQIAQADARLYAQPENPNLILLKLVPAQNKIKLIACQNDWVKIQTAGKSGWLSPGGQCANPVTTCS